MRSTSSSESYEKSPKRADKGETTQDFGWPRVLGILLVVAAYTPLRGYLGNIDKFPHVERLLVIVTAYLALGIAWFVLLERTRMRREAAVVSSLVLVLIASSGVTLTASLSTTVGILAGLGIAVAAALLINRMPRGLGGFVAVGGFAFLVVGLLLSWSGTGRAMQTLPPTVSSTMPETLRVLPDVFVVLLDGFPGDRAIQEVYQSNIEFIETEEIQRIEAWSSYPMTIASVASLLEMGYPLKAGDVIDEASSGQLARVMSGDNRFTKILDDHGYHITYVESGYSRSFCAETVDQCVESAFLDEGTHWILAQSILGMELRERTGSAFTQGALHTMDWLAERAPSFASNQRPDLVVANVLAPHPPLFLDAQCDVVFEYWRVGNSVYAGDEILEMRQDALIDQSQCVADFESRFFMAAPKDSVVLFVSDHGGDSLGQMSKADRIWDNADIVERMSVHLAARTPMPCDLEADVLLPEVLRDVLWCLAGSEPTSDDLNPRMFTGSRIEGTTDYRLDELTASQLEQVGVVDG